MVRFPISARHTLKYGTYQMEVLIRGNRVCNDVEFKVSPKRQLSIKCYIAVHKV